MASVLILLKCHTEAVSDTLWFVSETRTVEMVKDRTYFAAMVGYFLDASVQPVAVDALLESCEVGQHGETLLGGFSSLRDESVAVETDKRDWRCDRPCALARPN